VPPQFEQDWLIQLRLIHLCGQLDRERAMRTVRLPGREEWQLVAPVDFLAQVVLASDGLFSALRLPATEALAQCLGRPQLGLAETSPDVPESGGGGDAEWVETWYRDYKRARVRGPS
jgi:hypothetical protein